MTSSLNGEGREDSRRIAYGLDGGGRHEDGGLLWRHEFFHFRSKLLNTGRDRRDDGIYNLR